MDAKGKSFAHALIKAGNIGQMQRYAQQGLQIPQHDIGANPLLHTALRELRGDAGPMLQFLLANGANPLTVNAARKNILHIAAEIADLRFFNDFLKLGNDPNALTTANELPLHFALLAGNLPLVRILLTPQNLYHLTTRGDSLLTYALASFSSETVDFIFEAERQYSGVRPFLLSQQTNLQGFTPLSLAFAKQNDHPMHRRWIAHFLKGGIPSSAPTSPFKQAETQKLISIFAKAESPLREECLQAIYGQNPQWINAPLCYGLPLLHWAVYKGDINLVQFALTLGANVNHLSEGYPLYIAIEHNHFEMAVFLLSIGADPNLPFFGLNAAQYIQQRSLRPRVCFDPRFRNLF